MSLSLDGGSLIGFAGLDIFFGLFPFREFYPPDPTTPLVMCSLIFLLPLGTVHGQRDFPKALQSICCLLHVCVLAEDVTEVLVAASGHYCSWSWAQGTSHNLV